MIIVIHLFCILFLCVQITDRFNFWENLGAEIHRLVMGTKKPIKLPYILTCSLCQTWWLCMIYLLFTGHFTLIYIAVSALVAGFNQVCFQFLNLIEILIINIFKKMTL